MSNLSESQIAVLDKVGPTAAKTVCYAYDMNTHLFVIAGQNPLLLEPVGIKLTVLEALDLAALVVATTKGLIQAAALKQMKAEH